MNDQDWRARCLAAEDALRRARSKLMITAARRRILKALGELQAGRSLFTREIAGRVGVKVNTAEKALRLLCEAGFVDRGAKRGYNGAPVRWRLGHMVVPDEQTEAAADSAAQS